MDCGISEFDFWEMTVAEINRKVESHNRMYKIGLKEKAQFDYTLSAMIGRAIATVLDSKNGDFPNIETFYPTLFEVENEEDQQMKLSIARFKAFANLHNLKGGTTNGRSS